MLVLQAKECPLPSPHDLNNCHDGREDLMAMELSGTQSWIGLPRYETGALMPWEMGIETSVVVARRGRGGAGAAAE